MEFNIRWLATPLSTLIVVMGIIAHAEEGPGATDMDSAEMDAAEDCLLNKNC